MVLDDKVVVIIAGGAQGLGLQRQFMAKVLTSH